jgi:nucleotide-binding universal stress UspA family protein
MSQVQPLFPIEYTRILLPVDCTSASRNAVRQAARFAVEITGAAIMLVAVVPPHGSVAHAESALETARTLLRQCGVYSRTVYHRADSLADAVAAEAEAHPYDLIVAGNCESAPHIGLPILVLPTHS